MRLGILPFFLLVLNLCHFRTTAQNVVFSEDFDGQIPDNWIVSPVSSSNMDSVENAVWMWADNDGIPNDDYWLDFYHLQSPTANNGFAIFNVAYLDTGGIASDDPPTKGTGPAPAPLTSDLISPLIDCSSLQTVILSFHQELFRSGATTSIGISNDGGIYWDFIDINQNIGNLGMGTKDYNSVTTVDLTDYAAGEPDVRFCFRYSGDWYYWLVDDVIISDIPEVDLAIENIRYPLKSYAQPASQIATDTLRFNITVSNQGTKDLNNVVKKVSVWDDQNNEIFSDSILTSVFPAGYSGISYDFPATFIPKDLVIGIYKVRYEVYADGQTDFLPKSNSAEVPFEVTQDTYAKDYGEYFTGISWTGGDGSFRMGNLFETGDNWTGGFKAVSATTAMCCAPDLSGKTVPVLLYEVAPDVEPDWSNFKIDSNEDLIARGIGYHTFSDETFQDKVTIALNDIITEEAGVSLKPGTRYFLVAEFFDENADLAMQVSNKIEYPSDAESTVFWASGLNEWLIAGAGGLGVPPFVPLMRMEIAMDVTSLPDRYLPSTALGIYPNPASRRFIIRSKIPFLDDGQGLLTMSDTNGRILRRQPLGSGVFYEAEWEVEDLPPGIYFLRLSTPNGSRTERLVIKGN